MAKMVGIFFKSFVKGMKEFGSNVSVIVNTALLLILYGLGIGLTALIAKVSKKNLLETNISKAIGTYWSDLNLKKKPGEEYLRQF